MEHLSCENSIICSPLILEREGLMMISCIEQLILLNIRPNSSLEVPKHVILLLLLTSRYGTSQLSRNFSDSLIGIESKIKVSPLKSP